MSSTVATPRGSRRLLLAAAACASVATVTGIVVEGEFGLYHRASGAELWLAIGPGMAWLVAGLETLAGRAAIPVEVGALPSARLPPAVETAAYYVASEALANAVKHAHASHVRIDVTQNGTIAVVEIVDDGTGGADPRGSGLRGLRDRVEALDGSLTIASAQGQGTMLRAEFPCA